MSLTNINYKDQGYTSPDFLTNLFRKPLYSNISIESTTDTINEREQLKEIYNSCLNKQNKYGSFKTVDTPNSPLKFKNSPNKFVRTHSLIEDEKISAKKFKIFFKTFMHNYISEEKINHLWLNLEESMTNPFAFDIFIEDIKSKRQKQFQKQVQKNILQNYKYTNIKNRKLSKSFSNKIANSFQHLQCRSQEKYKIKQSKYPITLKNNVKDMVKQQLLTMKQIIMNGERLIRQK